MIIFHHSDNLDRRISTFHCYQLAYRLIIGSKSQITYSCFINHQFIDIITIFFGETSSGYYLPPTVSVTSVWPASPEAGLGVSQPSD